MFPFYQQPYHILLSIKKVTFTDTHRINQTARKLINANIIDGSFPSDITLYPSIDKGRHLADLRQIDVYLDIN